MTFHGRRRTGWVVGTAPQATIDADRVADLRALGSLPVFDAADLRLWRWVADRYAAPLAHVIRHAVPARSATAEREAAGWPAPGRGDGGPTAPHGARDPSPGWADYDAARLLAAIPRTSTPPPAFWWRPRADTTGDDLAVDLVGLTLAAGRGAVVVSPDPRSPLLEAVRTTFRPLTADHRSARTSRTRYRAHLRGRAGLARVAVGERAGVFAPVPDLGLVLVDDEASAAHKERRSPRHHVREVALARARMAGAVCVLRGDLPSAALWRLLEAGHVDVVAPHRDRERRARPRVDVIDLGSPRPGARRARMSSSASRALAQTVAEGGRAIVLAARAGTGAALACTACGQRRECPRCAASVRPVGSDDTTWTCPSCAWSGAPFACHVCGAHVVAPLAAGARRLTVELARAHPAAQVVRMEGHDAPGPTRRPAIAVMTRGSVVDEPGWLAGASADLVVAPDADGMLRRASVDAAEDTLRLWMAASRLAGRVIVQTTEPSHRAVQALVRWDAEGFWRREAEERRDLGLPPHGSLVRVVAEPGDREVADALRRALPDDARVLGPDTDGASLVVAADLRSVLVILRSLRDGWDRDGRGVRLDVDPVEGW